MHRHVLLAIPALAAAALAGCNCAGPEATAFEITANTASDFGTAVVGAESAELTFTVKNITGGRSGTIDMVLEGMDGAAYRLSSGNCSGEALEPGATCAVGVVLAPQSPGPKPALLVARASNGKGQLAIAGQGLTRALLQASPASNNFGTVPTAGSSPDATFTITNAGTQASGTLSVSLGGAGANQFTKPGDACDGQALAGGGTCTINVRFAPSGLGAQNATVTVTATPGGAVTIPVAGTGGSPAALAVNPTSGDFGVVDVPNQSADTTFTVTNTGSVNATNLLVTLAGDIGEFVKTGDTCNGMLVLAPVAGGSAGCTVKVAFKPTSFGTKNLTVTVSGRVANSSGTTQATVSPTGVGRQTFAVAVVNSGNGAGTVFGGGIDCGSTCNTTVVSAATAGTITLNAAPDATSSFSGWTGACAPSNPSTTCTLTVGSDKLTGAAFDLQRFSLTPVVSALTGSGGTLASQDGLINCTGASCAPVSYDHGTMVQLTATAGPGSRFLGWSGDCSGSIGTCVLNMTQARAATASFAPNANYAFVTSTRYTLTELATRVDPGGALTAATVVGGADIACNERAGAANLPGNYLAWIASSGASAGIRLGSARGWLRTDGLPFADQLPGNLFYPLQRDELGAAVSASTDVLTNADSAGAAQGACGDFTDNTGSSAVTGNPSGGSALWSSWSTTQGCGTSFKLYCLGTDNTAVVVAPPPPAGARRVFVSNGTFMPGPGGVPAANALCQTEATGATLPGTYKAVLATDGSSAASVFTTRGAAVVRPDNVVVAATDTDFFAEPEVLRAPPERTAGGSLAPPTALWTGAATAQTPGTAARTCTDWTSAAGTGGTGENVSSFRVFTLATDACSTAHVLLCLQE